VALIRVSVAEARRRFRELLDRLTQGDVVEIARRGEPAGVLVAPEEYRRLAGQGAGLAGAVAAFRRSLDEQEFLDDEALEDLRDPAPGRGAAL
jgi:prevent-host-death family protein